MEDSEDSFVITEPKASRISLHMIGQRHLPPGSKQWPYEQIVEELNKITHLRLDREHIAEIDGLELLGKSITNVYLQQNQIKVIENLECLENLSFLTLANNKIQKIENLTRLPKLAFLDLSENNITDFDIDELPQTLVILNLKGNPCIKVPDYRGRIIQDLPKLRQLDGVDITKQDRRDVGYSVSSSSEDEESEEEEEENNRMSQLGGTFEGATCDMLIRSQQRLEDNLKQHQKRRTIVDNLRLDMKLPPSRNSRSNTARSSVTPSSGDAG
ncbi:unnamed protein product [Owenia fusiformis]|uniref:Uncharacterized protein n=1 Tax=Owenia fusiformis TaxID=6347 RepID=A0A8J1Y4B0_OWEFU|nr:unnamed protein product [Owenia fusiformis]